MKKAAITTATAGIAITAFAAPAMASVNTVVVESGDTLWGIAQKNNTTVDSLKQLNKLTDDKIFPGQKLIINEVKEKSAEKSITATWLNVRQGPSVEEKILTSLKGGTTVTIQSEEKNGWCKISYENGKTGFVNGKYLGDVKAPAESKQKEPQPQKVKENINVQTEKITNYKVKSGDTLWGLSVRFHTSVQDLMALNKLSSSSIYVGQNLTVNGTPAQTAPQIEKETNTNAKEEVKQNSSAPVQKHVEAPNQKIKQEQVKSKNEQPKREVSTKKEHDNVKEESKEQAIDVNASSYTVRSGDSLSKIASIFHTNIDHLKSLNHLSSDFLEVGQVLKVKGQTPPPEENNHPTSHLNENKPTQNANHHANENKPSPNKPNPSHQSSHSSSSNSNVSFDKLYNEALKHEGTSYLYGASASGSCESIENFDCSSFTQHIFKSIGISLSRTSGAQYANSAKISESKAKPGDLVFFSYNGGRSISHVGLVIGGGKMINAQEKGVKIDSYHANGWGQYLVGFGRVANF